MSSNGVSFNDQGGLARGIRFYDVEAGKRVYHHNVNKEKVEYYIRQWKSTNQCEKDHPVGLNFETKSYQNFLNEIVKVINFRRKL